ncbi:lipocalin family protein [Pararhodobacter sp. CCB-MM2]|uniref:lipocalin family protein n=1 Tax=Pararhodobacter sp. CCB-MM2 TaxID=1786003 RepID=UPI00082F97C2|nr:lipocalin family protein [Pararhodobacter sp. CCB-MM2]
MIPSLLSPLRLTLGRTLPRAPAEARRPHATSSAAMALSGRWYEIARSPATRETDRFAATVDYRCHADGSLTVTRVGRVGSLAGAQDRQQGRATPEGNGRYRLAYGPTLPFLRQEHSLIALDEAAGLAVVGDPGKGCFWLLSREPHPPGAALAFAQNALADQGHDPALERAVQP